MLQTRPNPASWLAQLIARPREALARHQHGAALLAAYREVPPHVLADIGLAPSDIADAGERPAEAPARLAQRLRQRGATPPVRRLVGHI